MTVPIVIVQGAQWGSEAKGAVALALCERLGVRWAVRTGSINAGHTVWDGSRRIAFQQIPVGAVLPSVTAVLGPGAYVHVETTMKEAMAANCIDRLLIDKNCGVHLDSFTAEAKGANRSLKIGATGKGCAEAVIHKIADRGVGTALLFREHVNCDSPLASVPLVDTADLLNDAYDSGDRILLEGTQGSLLDLHCGPYPFTTSRQTTAAAWVCEAGISPALDYEVVLVARTYPIRVAGNSGPMGEEIDWPRLARRINARLERRGHLPLVDPGAVDEFEAKLGSIRRTNVTDGDAASSLHHATEALASVSNEANRSLMKLFETTTVTKRLRRIAELDVGLLKLTVKKERPAYAALTFLNYVFPELTPEHNPSRLLHDEARRYVNHLQELIGCRVRYASIGPRTEDLLEV